MQTIVDVYDPRRSDTDVGEWIERIQAHPWVRVVEAKMMVKSHVWSPQGFIRVRPATGQSSCARVAYYMTLSRFKCFFY